MRKGEKEKEIVRERKEAFCPIPLLPTVPNTHMQLGRKSNDDYDYGFSENQNSMNPIFAVVKLFFFYKKIKKIVKLYNLNNVLIRSGKKSDKKPLSNKMVTSNIFLFSFVPLNRFMKNDIKWHIVSCDV